MRENVRYLFTLHYLGIKYYTYKLLIIVLQYRMIYAMMQHIIRASQGHIFNEEDQEILCKKNDFISEISKMRVRKIETMRKGIYWIYVTT